MYIGPLERYEELLPWHGVGTDNLEFGLRVYSAQYLINKAYAQYNPRNSISWLAYDLDSDTARFDWSDRSCAPPNILALSRATGHAHAFYGIDPAVHNNDTSRPGPLRYLASIDVAMTTELEADPGFAQLVAKNPLHSKWDVLTPRIRLYNLDELASWVDLEKYHDRRRRLPEVGYGRNCTLFERLRLRAYKMRREAWLNEEMFAAAVLTKGYGYNDAFEVPLPHAEVRHTAKSISKWTWSHMSPEGFIARQKWASGLATVARKKKALDLRDRILRTIEECPTLSQGEIATLLGVTRRTVINHLNEIRGVKSPLSG